MSRSAISPALPAGLATASETSFPCHRADGYLSPQQLRTMMIGE